MTNRLTTVVLLVLFLAVSPLARSQPLADRLPSDTILYVGWAGSESLDGYNESHLKAVLDASDIPALFTEFLPKALETAAKEDPEVQHFAEALRSSAASYRHPFAIAFTGVDWQKQSPRLVILSDAGNDADAQQQTFQKAVDIAAQEGAPFPVKVTRSGTLVALTVGYDRPDAQLALAKPTNPLSGTGGFKAAFAQLNKKPALAAYVDVQAAVRLAERAAAEGGNAEMAREWPKVRDALGLPGLRAIAVSTGFDERDWATDVFVDAPAPRKGLLAAFDAAPLDEATFKAIPQDAISAGGFQFDLAGLLGHVRNIAGEIEPSAPQQIDDGIHQINAMLDLDVERDLFGSFGSQWAYYSSPSVGGQGILGIALINRLKDPAKTEQSLKKVADLANQLIEQNAPDKEMQIRVKQTKAGDLTVHYVGIPFVTPSWAIKDGNLYVGLYPQVVSAAAKRGGAGAGKSILDNPKFAAMRARVRAGGGSVSAFQFDDLQATAPQSYGSWLAVSRLVGVGDLVGIDSPPMVLPELSVLMGHLGPAGSASWGDDAGLHFRAVSPFPGSSLLSQDPMAQMWSGQAAVATSVLLPALNRAREQANRVKSASNLRQIGLACHIIANDSKGIMPNDVGEIVLKQDDLTAEVFVSPRRESASPPRNFPNREAMATWVRENSDFVYVGKGMDIRRVPTADTLLAYENPDGLNDGVNMLFADGHVEFVLMADALQRIQGNGAGGGKGVIRPPGAPRPPALHPAP